MPGVLVVEAMAQVGGLLTQLSLANAPEKSEKLFYLVKVDKARFSKMVVPGDQLDIEVFLKRTIRNMAMYECVARVDGKEAASAEILCAEGKA
jgi:3-hydroxyacyl-[acyl-carrier-protein] dehydratase